MNIQLTNIIKNWIPDDSRVIDFGCGDGSLLKDLVDQKNVCGYGVEIDHKKIQECVMKGISVIEKDIDEGIQDF
jgi:methionine biosynthesis protein MetW